MRTNRAGLDLIKYFKGEYEPAEGRINAEKAVTLLIKRPITHNQFSALVCLIMGIGIDLFKESNIIKLLNKGNGIEDRLKAANEFDKYIYDYNDDGERIVDQFLIAQRTLEKDLFLKSELVKKRKIRVKSIKQ